jgi:hypothetical protein
MCCWAANRAQMGRSEIDNHPELLQAFHVLQKQKTGDKDHLHGNLEDQGLLCDYGKEQR